MTFYPPPSGPWIIRSYNIQNRIHLAQCILHNHNIFIIILCTSWALVRLKTISVPPLVQNGFVSFYRFPLFLKFPLLHYWSRMGQSLFIGFPSFEYFLLYLTTIGPEWVGLFLLVFSLLNISTICPRWVGQAKLSFYSCSFYSINIFIIHSFCN